MKVAKNRSLPNSKRDRNRKSFYRASADADQPAQQDTETTMNARQNTKSEPTLEQLIGSIEMSEAECEAALQGARMGACISALFGDAIVWVRRKFGRSETGTFAKPSSKYLNPPHEYRQG